MAAEKTLALVIRAIEFSETSSVVTLFTRDFGKVRALAKGARRPKGPFESALDLLSLCRIVFLRKLSEALDLLTEAKLERRFRPPARDLSRLYAGYYIAELLNELTDDADPHPDLFDAADYALRRLASPAGNVAAIVLRFELAALRLVGHQPALDECAECGRPVAVTGRVAFGALSGGVLCGTCRPGKRQVVSLSGKSLSALRRLAAPDMAVPEDGAAEELAPDHIAAETPVVAEAAEEETIDRRELGEIRGAMNQYVCHLLGRRPRMHGFLGTS